MCHAPICLWVGAVMFFRLLPWTLSFLAGEFAWNLVTATTCTCKVNRMDASFDFLSLCVLQSATAAARGARGFTCLCGSDLWVMMDTRSLLIEWRFSRTWQLLRQPHSMTFDFYEKGELKSWYESSIPLILFRVILSIIPLCFVFLSVNVSQCICATACQGVSDQDLVSFPTPS